MFFVPMACISKLTPLITVTVQNNAWKYWIVKEIENAILKMTQTLPIIGAITISNKKNTEINRINLFLIKSAKKRTSNPPSKT